MRNSHPFISDFALEEAYRNQIMVGKFPACVLHLNLPANAVDVNVHPAKTEVKFLNEKTVFDCVHYGVLGALNTTPDRPNVQFKAAPSNDPTSLRGSAHTAVAISNYFSNSFPQWGQCFGIMRVPKRESQWGQRKTIRL